MIWIQHEGHFQELVEVKIYTPTSLMLMPPYMTQGSFSAVPQRPDMYVEYIYIEYMALFSYGYAIEWFYMISYHFIWHANTDILILCS